MFVELHIIQNFAPSNLNRDDTGAPKTCEFGGYRRARISSQALKRAIRTTFAADALIPAQHRAVRTKRIAEEVTRRLVAAGKEADAAAGVVDAAIQGMGLKFEKPKAGDAGKKTEYLLFLGEQEIAAVVDICLRHWDALAAFAPASSSGASARDAKKAAKASVPPAVRQQLLDALDGGKAADVALFGRMLADLPERNVDAACQVAHAISTHRVSTEFDFYTAVDDLKPLDTAGADMLGTVEFNSACYYRYANIDLEQLRRNLSGDDELARATVGAFLRASVSAIPTGKQNSMAAQNPPAFVLAVVRERGLWSLAKAFANPVWADRDGGLIDNSVAALRTYLTELMAVYGGSLGLHLTCVSVGRTDLDWLEDTRVFDIDELVEAVLTRAFSADEAVGVS